MEKVRISCSGDYDPNETSYDSRVGPKVSSTKELLANGTIRELLESYANVPKKSQAKSLILEAKSFEAIRAIPGEIRKLYGGHDICHIGATQLHHRGRSRGIRVVVGIEGHPIEEVRATISTKIRAYYWHEGRRSEHQRTPSCQAQQSDVPRIPTTPEAPTLESGSSRQSRNPANSGNESRRQAV